MSFGRPPSSRPSPGADPRLDAARGLIRDALGSIRNLEQLLKSIRVGPKALSAVIPDVHASCAPLLGAIREVLAAFREQLPDGRAPDALEAFVAPRVETMERALAKARRAPLNAKNRLTLEGVVAEVAEELDAARALMDVLEDALAGPAVRVDLLELVRSAGRAPEGEERVTIDATLAPPTGGIELIVNPRLAMWLLGLGVQMMAAGAPPTVPHVALMTASSEGGLRVERAPAPGEPLSLTARNVIAPTLACAHAAARVGGAHITHDDNLCTILWSTPPT